MTTPSGNESGWRVHPKQHHPTHRRQRRSQDRPSPSQSPTHRLPPEARRPHQRHAYHAPQKPPPPTPPPPATPHAPPFPRPPCERTFQLFQHLGAEALLQRGASIKLLVSALGAPPRHGGHASGAAATDAAAVADAPSASTRAILPRVGGSHTTGVWEAAGGSARPRATTVPIDGQPPDAAADRGVLPHRQRPGGARHTRVGRPTAPIRGCPIAAQPPPPSAFNQETHAFRQLSPRQQLA